MKTVIKSRAAGFLTAAAVITAGLIQPVLAQPVRAGEDGSGGAAVSYVDMYGATLDELAPIAVGMFSDGPDYKQYGLYDMTGDGIKELLIYHEGDYEDTIGYYVYTWDGTQVVRCQEKILRGGQLRGSGTSVLELHAAPRAWSKIVMKWDLVGSTLQGDIFSKSSMDDESFPDSFPDWANAEPIEFSADMYDRSILEKESGGVTDIQPDAAAAAGQDADPAADAPTGLEGSGELTQMVNMLYRLYDHNVSIAESPDIHTDLASLSTEDKSRVLDYYQSHFADQDDRIQRDANNIENNIATKETLTQIMTELFGSADEETMNTVYASYWIRGIEGDVCYMSSIGFGTMASNYIFGQYETAGYDEDGQIVLTGKVYDWSDPDYNSETEADSTPRGTYRIMLAPEGGPAVFNGYQFREMTVEGM